MIALHHHTKPNLIHKGTFYYWNSISSLFHSSQFPWSYIWRRCRAGFMLNSIIWMGQAKPDYVAEDRERGRERERGRKHIFLYGRWRGCSTESDKDDENTTLIHRLGFVCLAAGTARCMSVWPVALFPQSSGIFQASPMSTNKAMELFCLSHGYSAYPRFAQLGTNCCATV